MVLSPMNKKLQAEHYCWEGDNTGQINSLKGYLLKQRKKKKKYIYIYIYIIILLFVKGIMISVYI